MAQTHHHGGHRARLRKRWETAGLRSFEPHEVIELLLFFVIPQRDVNPLAHELIHRFGSVAGVLAAEPEALKEVANVGAYTAGFLSFLHAACARYAKMRLTDRPKITNIKMMSARCAELFDPSDQEQIWMLCMNMTGHLLGSSELCSGDWRTRLTLRQAIEPALRYEAQTVLLLQRRRPGNVVARDEDVDFTVRLARQLDLLNIRLLDSVIMSDHSIISLRKTGLYRLGGERGSDELRKLCEHWLDEEEFGQ